MSASRATTRPRTSEAEFVLPPPPHGRAAHAVRPAPGGTELLQRCREGLAGAGSRLRSLLDCQGLFLAEVRAQLTELDETLHEDSRARIKAQLRSAVDVLEWCEAVQLDLQFEAARAQAGEQAFELVALVDAAIHDLRASGHRVDLTVHGGARRAVWGDLERVGHALQQAILLVQERLGGPDAALRLELHDDEEGPHLELSGRGDPVGRVTRERVQAFRAAAIEAGLRVLPDALGPGGAGMVLHFYRHG